ncbi:cysteine-rich small domain-containing protein [Cetobacterium sp.]|uniref:cysteine-rich small domain-containing protein n=1 Tax=Cetobacterium sp. TaxID=2071632 RepID=UPI003F4069E8
MNYKFNQNKNCEFFPCHKIENKEDFNCLFCYCPLYMLGNECGGQYKHTVGGIKDCSDCILPHIKDIGYDHIQKKMMTVLEIVRNKHLKDIGEEDKIVNLK